MVGERSYDSRARGRYSGCSHCLVLYGVRRWPVFTASLNRIGDACLGRKARSHTAACRADCRARGAHVSVNAVQHSGTQCDTQRNLRRIGRIIRQEAKCETQHTLPYVVLGISYTMEPNNCNTLMMGRRPLLRRKSRAHRRINHSRTVAYLILGATVTAFVFMIVHCV